MMKHEERVSNYRQRVEHFLRTYYANLRNEPQSTLFEAMEYSLMAGGKRIRSTLALEFCRVSGGDWEKMIPMAAALEMIHTYSLIHDDLPCMDNDDFRRGKPTNHKVYGEAMAILAGDALLTDAFAVMASAELPSDSLRLALQVLSECAGSLGMVGGQVLDIQSQTRMLTEQEVLDIQTRKTGALIRAACAIGAIAGGATQEQYEAACQYASGIGLAFQIRDDMLDVIGTAEEMGKSVGTDSDKNTFVRLYGMEKCEKLVWQYTEYAVSALQCFDDTDYLKQLAMDMATRMK